jgi:CheY-like chemotaxis protein
MNKELILIAEDNEDEILLVRLAFHKAKVANPLHFVRDGLEAISYLAGADQYSNRAEYPLPSLFLLDLKMPRVDGFEVLEWVREQPSLARLRIVILTGSHDVRDVNKAYELGASSYLIKPVDFSQFVDLSVAVHGYWMWLSKLPETHSEGPGPGSLRLSSLSRSPALSPLVSLS